MSNCFSPFGSVQSIFLTASSSRRSRGCVPIYLTRCPTTLMRTYYGQRAYQGGLMITEATFISPTGNGGYASPGIFTAAQVAGFRRVFPLQPMPDHVDDPAHYTPVINPSYAMRQREMWRDPRQLALAQ